MVFDSFLDSMQTQPFSALLDAMAIYSQRKVIIGSTFAARLAGR